MLDMKFHLFSRFNNAVRDHLQPVSVAVIGMKGRNPCEIGSGTCVEIDGRFFVATAEHVVAPYSNDDLWLVIRHGLHSYWTPRILGRGVDIDFDVAWLEIHPDDARIGDRRFIPLSWLRAGCGHLESDIVVMHGFPRDLVTVENKQVGVQPICYAAATLGPDNITGHRSDRDIHLAFPDEHLLRPDGAPFMPLEAPGLSGGGLWAVDVNCRGLWTPESCRLIGIEHSWLRFKWVKGSQIQHWLATVVRDLPELGAHVAAAIPSANLGL